jgi:hypothetical protein
MDIQLSPHFQDFIDARPLISDERLPGRDGTPGAGMKLGEVIDLAETWWFRSRFAMPDFGKPVEKLVVKSGVMRGAPWSDLTHKEKLRVLANWYAHVGIFSVIEGKGTSRDGEDAENLDKLRGHQTKVLPVLGTQETHARVSEADEDAVWGEQQDLEDFLLDANGEKIAPKEKTV